MLEIKNLTKQFNNTIAVNNINFKVEPGKIFGLLGPNGAGKTTTIRTILDIIKPTTGEVLFNGKPLEADFLNKTGYLPEERGLYKKSKVIDIIRYFAELKGLSAQKAVADGIEWLKKLEIPQYKDRKLEELSKGNQQKVQFIIAILHNPDVLILDEPFSGFDPINQQIIKDLILSFVSTGKMIILSTHQMEIAEKLCNDIFLINEGREVCSGNINEVRRKFGKNTIKIEYSGDLSFAKSFNYIESIDSYNNYSEIILKDNTSPNILLRDLIDKVEITGFNIVEATLHKIFIDVIKATETGKGE